MIRETRSTAEEGGASNGKKAATGGERCVANDGGGRRIAGIEENPLPGGQGIIGSVTVLRRGLRSARGDEGDVDGQRRIRG